MIETLGAGWVRFVFEHSVDLPVYLVGDFNGWNESSHLMEPQDDGTYQALVKLPPGEFEFKYKCGAVWHNDPCAHKYVPNCWGSENSVVVVSPTEGSQLDSRPAPESEEEALRGNGAADADHAVPNGA